MDKITERIERQAGIPGLAALLAERLSPTDLQSLLLAVNRLRSARIRPADVLTGYAADRFVRPSPVSPVVMLRWDQIAFAHLPPGFEPIALAPVCPLGTNAAVAAIDPNWAVATIRNTEVVSDSTNVLALEAALRRRALLRANPKSAQPVHLAASHRLLRGQHYDSPLAFAHFGAFALCSAGRDRGTLRFELSTLDLHIRFYLETLHAFLGPGVPLYLSVTDLAPAPRLARLEDELLVPIRAAFDNVVCGFDPDRQHGRTYYANLCFHIHAGHPTHGKLELVDGGDVDWTQAYLSNAKERLVISGIGSERLCSAFGDTPPTGPT